jgi:MscS family membrane protein
MDRAFAGSLYKISTSPEGVPQEGVPKDHQKIGVLAAGDAEVPVLLAKVGDTWLFSSDTLAKVPDIYDQLQAQLFETRLPTPLVSNLFLGMPIWQWLALVLAIPAAAGLAWLVVAAFGVGRHFWRGLRKIQEPPK